MGDRQPALVSATAADPDNGDAEYATATRSRCASTARPTSAARLNVSIPTAVVEEMLGPTDGAAIDLGAAVMWSDATTLTLTIVSSADKSPDLADVGLAAAAGFATGIVVACKPAGAFPIRDAAAQFLPSVCNTTVGGDTATAAAADPNGGGERANTTPCSGRATRSR